MNHWFTIDHINKDTHIISEYRHWEETHAYLLEGTDRSLLIDSGLGICNIYDEVRMLTDKPVIAVATHIHWDHIGGKNSLSLRLESGTFVLKVSSYAVTFQRWYCPVVIMSLLLDH